MPVACDTFDLYPKLDQIGKIFPDLFIMLSISKAQQLGVTVMIVLVTYHTELCKISSIYPEMHTIPLNDFNPGSFLQ